ncbi:MAG: glycosyltransferase [Fibrobacter sp.]|nr:glycosyltransferase [Fibrobacter sp.]
MEYQGQECILFKSSSGQQSALLRDATGKTQLLHSAVNPQLEAELLAPTEIWGDVILCLGTGLGYHLQELAQVKGKIIVLCESFPNLLAAAQKVVESSENTVISALLTDPEQNYQALTILRDQLHLLEVPTLQIIRHPASYRFSRILCEDFTSVVFQDLSSLRYGSSEPSAYIRNEQQRIVPQSSPKSQRVLLLFGHHFLQQEVLNALQNQENVVKCLDYQHNDNPGVWESTVMRELQDFLPHIIISINMKGIDHEGILVDAAMRLGIPINCWFVDDPRPIALGYSSRLYPHIKAFCWEKAYLSWLMEVGFSTPQWLPLAGDPQIFSLPKSAVSPQYPLAFTGSAMASSFLDSIRQAFLWNPQLETEVQIRAQQLLEEILSAPKQKHCQVFDVLNNWDLPFDDERNRTWLSSLVQHSASHLKRRHFLAELLEQDLLLAGDPEGWRETFGPNVNTVPDINYRQNLCAHYQNIDLHINISSCQMPNAVNQRVFDIPLAGALVLSDAQSDLAELFGKNTFSTFNSKEELQDLIRYYQLHESEKRNVILKQRRKILNEHTYEHRLQKLLIP